MDTRAGALDTAEQMLRLFKRLRHLVDNELSGCGLSISRTKVLSELIENGPQQQSVLATTFGLAPRTVTELVDTLERDGLVERHTDPSDRRARQIHITPAGELARVQGIAVRERIIHQVFGTLTPDQLDGLGTSLHIIQIQLDKIAADGGLSGSAAGTLTP